MPRQFFTIGHSTRSIPEFVSLLSPHEIELVADVRSIPGSRTNPQYNAKELADALSGFQIGYQHIPSLGGLRSRAREVPQELNAFWRNQSFHNYADYALSEQFRSGLRKLLEQGHVTTCAIMCSEAVWWRCHRRIIADYLIASGETVFHILQPSTVTRAHLTEGARVGPDGTVSYPPGDSERHTTPAAGC